MSRTAKAAAVPREQEWLNGAERSRLEACEATLRQGAQVDLERGRALAEIRDSRLYRATHETFEAYCAQPQWRLSRAHAYRLIDLAGVTAVVSPIADTPAPANSAVARELAPLRDQPEAMRGAWSEAVERHGPSPTAEQVHEVVRDVVRGSAPVLQPPGKDTRFVAIEDANASLRLLPVADRIAWPIEDGDVDAIDGEVRELAGRTKAIVASWAQHKRDLAHHKRAQRGLRAVS